MKIATIIVRGFLGLLFVVFGANMLLNFIPLPPPPPGLARDFMTVMGTSHYLYIVGILEVAAGVLLFIGRWTPLGLALVIPVIVNIVCFHALMEPSGMPIAIVAAALAGFLFWRYRGNFSGLFKGPIGLVDTHRQQIDASNATAHT